MLGNSKLLDVLSADRERIMSTIREPGEYRDAEFRRQHRRRPHPPRRPAGGEHSGDPAARMQSERQRVAAQARAEGAEAVAKIRADAERDRTVLLADARATADNLRGEGEAEATPIYAEAFGQDPDFFPVWRTLQGYRDSFASGSSRLVLTPDNDYLRCLQRPGGPTR